jgi:hypothetical protein
MRWIERQLPEGDEVFLDHVGWFVADLDAAADAFRRLGFAIHDESLHMNADAEGRQVPAGTANRLVTTEIGYLEVLAQRSDTPLGRQLASGVARYEGLHLVAFGHADVPGRAPLLGRAGFRPLEPVNLRREMETEQGPTTFAFTVLRVPPDVMPEGRIQWCAHLTPESVWRPALVRHANAADALTGALFVVADVGEALDRYARFTTKPPVRRDGIGALDLDRGTLLFAEPAAAERLLPGLAVPTLPFGAAVSIRSRDLDATRRALAAGGVRPVRDADGRVAVRPEDACGTWTIFHEGGVEDPFAASAR